MVDKALCERIKYIRKYLGLTQTEYATAVESQQGTISDIERNVIEPSKEILTKNIEKFDVSGTWLLSGRGSIWLNKNIYTYSTDINELPVVREDIVVCNNDPPPSYGNKRRNTTYGEEKKYETKPAETELQEIIHLLQKDNKAISPILNALRARKIARDSLHDLENDL